VEAAGRRQRHHRRLGGGGHAVRPESQRNQGHPLVRSHRIKLQRGKIREYFLSLEGKCDQYFRDIRTGDPKSKISNRKFHNLAFGENTGYFGSEIASFLLVRRVKIKKLLNFYFSPLDLISTKVKDQGHFL